MCKLFTFFLDYNGGTYISQFQGIQLEKVFNDWIDNFAFDKLGLENDNHQIEDLDESFVPIDDLENVWCITFYIANKLALVHIVETECASNMRTPVP